MITYDEAKNLLSGCGQEHILRYYDELSDEERKSLLAQIEGIDFSILDALEKDRENVLKRGKIEPIEAVTISDIKENSDEYRRIGLRYARLRFTTESAQECVDVLRAYLGQGDYRPADFTRGLFYRGVE